MSDLYERSQEDEMALALKESRQPLCVYCERPLDRVMQTQYNFIEWKWDSSLRKYVKQEPDADSDASYHPECQTKVWGYVHGELVCY